MSQKKIKRALIAVFDKTGIADFARTLVEEFGIEIISTGGTAKHLKETGITVTMVEEVTGFPEMLDGRVKTLHPKIHAAILADRDKPEHMRQLAEQGIEPIDMVVVNLYPFEKTVADPNCKFEDAIEMIDIGGPCLLRASAKNHKDVIVVPDTASQDTILAELKAQGAISAGTRCQCAARVFAATSGYDTAISDYMSGGDSGQLAANRICRLHREATTKYGENPAQSAAVYSFRHPYQVETNLLFHAESGTNPLVSGEEMSFNNYVDGDAALALVKELTLASLSKYTVAFIKHTNACGCAIGDDPVDTYRRAYLGDPIAAAGGVLCMNTPVTKQIAEVVMNTFPTWGKAAGAAFFKLDVWIAPGFDDDAVKLITTPTEKRKWGATCRLLTVGKMETAPDEKELDYKRITGGMLVQTRDLLGLNEGQWKVVTKRRPTEQEMADLRFAWLVCKHTKSNAITICRDNMLLGGGAGQMSRVKSCDLAIQLARENGHGDRLAEAVAAGDAFFPVPDGPQKLIDAGITAIIHPGGGNRDADTVALCDEAGVAMIMTGTRHFKH
ncbi:MAG: bifunctional phosphoribosylaminoimidazolecarboxamide formyltransferase/IMP cyclohydrolase [Phycisphaerales bacterium]|nr:bifunctional phosphoribosylaminoimidazolecarboxamide formyltransferase/IMP cyclohydrolase [Phycisphaerales bacterium]